MASRQRPARRHGALPVARTDWAYFLDVDGSLIEIAESPDAVQVDEALPKLIAALHSACDGALALISGRTLVDLDLRLGCGNIPLAGQHGLEWRDATGRRRSHSASAGAIRQLRQQLELLVGRHPGLLLENKGLSVALHYRQAPRLASWLHRLLTGWVAQRSDLQLQKGKRVLEIKPAGFDKGTVITEFMAEAPFCGRIPVFIGDDVTDECGFIPVNSVGGYSIKVGPGRTAARYRLHDVAAVRQWLTGALSIPVNISGSG
ncbi:MAG: trehalose-phosphatase [Candidatus Accumulibacter sp. UW26]|jgi:trehalose 6-phosphate phosphatase